MRVFNTISLLCFVWSLFYLPYQNYTEYAAKLKQIDHIDNEFIPLTKDQRAFLALPVLFGGMGIPIFSDLAVEYAKSVNATKGQYQTSLSMKNWKSHPEIRSKCLSWKTYTKECIEINVDQTILHVLKMPQVGSSLLLPTEKFNRTKGEFFDAVIIKV